MEIYLPIAGLPINFFILMSLGLVVGFLSGMFGVGGGFFNDPHANAARNSSCSCCSI